MATIHIRGVSEETHERLRARAAAEGVSLSEYLRRELDQLVARPTLEEFIDRLAKDPPAHVTMTAAEALHAERAERGAT